MCSRNAYQFNNIFHVLFIITITNSYQQFYNHNLSIECFKLNAILLILKVIALVLQVIKYSDRNNHTILEDK